MNRDVAEADHLLHAYCEIGWQNARGLQEGKCVTTFLRQSQPPLADHVHGQIDGCFAGALEIEDDRVLFRLIREQMGIVSIVLLEDPPKASLDAGGFVENDIVSHTPTRFRGLVSGSRAAPR